MKRIIIALLIIILSFTALSLALLYSPLPSVGLSSETQYDANYFINKITSDNVKIFDKNKYVITQTELSGYVNQHLKDINSIEGGGYFTIDAIDVKISQQEILLFVYGKYAFLPVKLQITLTPFYDKDNNNVVLKIVDMKVSKVNLPPGLYKRFIREDILNEGYIIPIGGPEHIIITDIEFADEAILIYYQIDSRGVLEDLFKSFFGR